MTDHQFSVLANVLGEDLTPDIAANVIQGMSETAEGEQMLRQIVRDFPNSEAADRIINNLLSTI